MQGVNFNVDGHCITFTGFLGEVQAFQEHERIVQAWQNNKALFPEVGGSNFQVGRPAFDVFVDENTSLGRINQIAQDFLNRILQN